MTVVDEKTSTVERNKAVIRRIFDEIINQGNLDLADELLTPDTDVRVPFADPGSGPQALKKIVGGLRQGFPDLHLEIDELIGEGDLVAVSWHSTQQTHLGAYRGLPPTGKAIRISGSRAGSSEREADLPRRETAAKDFIARAGFQHALEDLDGR